MKTLVIIVLALISISSCQHSRRDHPHEGDTVSSDNFDWLIGSWMRSNDKEGNITYEYWSKNSSTEYIGLGCTLHNSDTIFKENLRLIKTGEKWNLEVTGVNENPTLFLILSHSKSSFECENRNNEFPKNIEYTLRDNILLAKISDGDTEIRFSFDRMLQK
ncbi:MAG: hypothetical protein KAI08_07165 [Bacteroidales bacterium]|nr:hypothetical protein [Bacteroidales bacterium]